MVSRWLQLEAERTTAHPKVALRTGIPLACVARRDHFGPTDLKEAAQSWREDGFVILPGFIPHDELKPAAGELDLLRRRSGRPL
jgi:hypothetical protein